MRPSPGTERRHPVAMFAAFIDIDGLKAVNDRGDAVIQKVAQALQAVTRPGDLVVRYGGDEFIVIGLGEAPDPDALRERVIATVAQPSPIAGWDGTVSVGTCGSVDGDVAGMIRGADEAMYARRNRSR